MKTKMIALAVVLAFVGTAPAYAKHHTQAKEVNCEQIAKQTAAHFNEKPAPKANHDEYLTGCRYGIDMARMGLTPAQATADFERVAHEVTDPKSPEYKATEELQTLAYKALYARELAYKAAKK